METKILNFNARWLRDMALATSNQTSARPAREWLKYAAAFMLIFTLGVGNVWGAITPLSLPHDFGDVGKGSFTNTLGCTYTISGSNYSSDPKLCFKTQGDHLTIQLAEAPCCVSYHIKGNSFSGGTFKLQESADGSSYTDVASYTTLGATQNERKDLKSTTRYIKFVYTSKSSGNVGLGSISIDKACLAVDVTDGDPVILPAGSESYTTSDWSANGAPTSYIDGTYNINGYCVSLVQAGDYATDNGLQMKKSSNGVLTIRGITSTSGVDVDVVIGSSTGMSVALTGATSKTGQTTGTTTISTSSTSATLVITATSGSASYVKYIKITPKAASCAKSVTIQKGTETNCTISASAASVLTCSETRQVTISVTPNTCYAAPVKASVTSTGTTATWVSGPTLNSGHYDYVYSFAENATGETTFNASLSTKTTYTVNYDKGTYGTGSNSSDTKTCGVNLALPSSAMFTRDHYTQTGWSTAAAGNTKTYNLGASYTTDAGTTLYPYWEAEKYTVTWSVNGSTYTTTANVSYNTTTSTPANPNVPDECTGSTFRGWTATQNYTGDSAPGDLFNGTSPTITGNITFYAVFADYAD